MLIVASICITVGAVFYDRYYEADRYDLGLKRMRDGALMINLTSDRMWEGTLYAAPYYFHVYHDPEVEAFLIACNPRCTVFAETNMSEEVQLGPEWRRFSVVRLSPEDNIFSVLFYIKQETRVNILSRF